MEKGDYRIESIAGVGTSTPSDEKIISKIESVEAEGWRFVSMSYYQWGLSKSPGFKLIFVKQNEQPNR